MSAEVLSDQVQWLWDFSLFQGFCFYPSKLGILTKLRIVHNLSKDIEILKTKFLHF
jgi:hypothetical protein